MLYNILKLFERVGSTADHESIDFCLRIFLWVFQLEHEKF